MSEYSEDLITACWQIWELYRTCGDDEYMHHGEPWAFSRNDFRDWVFKISRVLVYLQPAGCAIGYEAVEAVMRLGEAEPDEYLRLDLIEAVLEATGDDIRDDLLEGHRVWTHEEIETACCEAKIIGKAIGWMR